MFISGKLFGRVFIAGLFFGLVGGVPARADENKVEIPSFVSRQASFPPSIDILGARTGMTIQQVETALAARGLKISGKKWSEKLYACEPLRRWCFVHKGDRKYNNHEEFYAPGQIVTVYVTPPFAGSLVYEIRRVVSYANGVLPTFENVSTDASAKFGKAVVWNDLRRACWEFKDGAPRNPPEKRSRQACSGANRFDRDFSKVDGELTISIPRNSSEVVYLMIDRLLATDYEVYLSERMKEQSDAVQARDKDMRQKASTPDL